MYIRSTESERFSHVGTPSEMEAAVRQQLLTGQVAKPRPRQRKSPPNLLVRPAAARPVTPPPKKETTADIVQRVRSATLSAWRYRPSAATVAHESGHALVAFALAGTSALHRDGCWAASRPDEDGTLGETYVDRDSLSVDNHLAILSAGVIGEEELLQADSEIRGSDQREALVLVRSVDGWVDDLESSASWKRARVKARSVVRKNLQLLDSLAGHLSVEGKLHRFQITSVLRNRVKKD